MKVAKLKRIPRGAWTAVALVVLTVVSTVGCRVSGASVELLPMDRWGFNGPRTLSFMAFGPQGDTTTQPIASITTVGCLQIWTPAN